MAGQRGRKPGFRMTEEHRGKIKQAAILNALQEHVTGKRDMSATQVSAGLGLLRKVLPDLQATTISGDKENPLEIRETDPHARLKALAAILSKAK